MANKPVTGQTTFGSNTTGTTTQLDNNFLLAYNAINDFNTYSNYLADTGAANAYVVTLGANLTGALTDGLIVQFKASAQNTGASTLNYNSTGAKNILTLAGDALPQGAIPSGGYVQVQYASADTSWRLQTSVVPVAGSFTGFRNRIINGDIRIDQANAGASVTVNSAAVTYGPDMWNGWGTGAAGVFTMQQLSATPPAGFNNYLRIQTTTADAAPAAGSAYYVTTKIEGLNLIDFQLGMAGAVQFTTSLQMRSSLTGTFSGSFLNGAANRSYPWTCTINAANTWTPIVVTLTGDTAGVWATDNTIGLHCIFDIGSGANGRGAAGAWAAATNFGVTGAVRLISTLNATLDITGVQIEKGAVATPFEVRGFQEELARVQRYYAKTFSYSVAPAAGLGTAGALYGKGNVNPFEPFCTWRFPVAMRTAPSVSLIVQRAGGAAGQWSSGATDGANARVLSTGTDSTLIDNSGIQIADANEYWIHATASARL